MPFSVTDNQIQDFHRDGYLIVRNLFDAEEIDILRTTARADSAMTDHARDIEDASGKVSKLTLWNHPGDDVFGLASRCRRVVDTAEALLDDEVYHYHSKLSIKEPHVGGAWEWHQDYGYWYDNGCLFPDMLSCMTALDPATRENGCMQVLKGSHKAGRIEHGVEGEQSGADLKRVNELSEVLDLVYCEMNPGDALFFHGNTLHCSAPNESDDPRWVLISCYNARSNNPTNADQHPQYTPLDKVDDSAIKAHGIQASDGNQQFMETKLHDKSEMES
jgi:ectoine hydroxylase